MNYKLHIFSLALIPIFPLFASTCFAPSGYIDLSKKAKTIAFGTVQVRDNKFFLKVEKSWHPLDRVIEFQPMTNTRLKYNNDALAYPLDLSDGDWLFIMSLDDSKDKIYIPGCGKLIETLSKRNMDFKIQKLKLENKVVTKVTKILGPPKFFPNSK